MTTGPYLVGGIDVRPTSSCVDVRRRWREHVVDNHGRLEFRFGPGSGFSGATRVQRAAAFQLVEFWSDPVCYRRVAGAVDHDEDDTMRLLMPLYGELRVRGRGSPLRLSPGEAAVMSMHAGFEIDQRLTARALILSLPNAAWNAPPRDIAALALDRGAGAVASVTLRRLAAEREHLDADSFASACAAAVALVSGSPLAPNLLDQSVSIARENSDDAAFDPSALAGLLGWSLRYVQKELQRTGTTPAEVIRTARLEQAARRLRSPAWATTPISEVAHASGFASLSSFNSAFRSRYRVTPSAYRVARDDRTSPLPPRCSA